MRAAPFAWENHKSAPAFSNRFAYTEDAAADQ